MSFAVADIHAVRVSETDELRTTTAVYGGIMIAGTIVGAVLLAVMFGNVLTDLTEG